MRKEIRVIQYGVGSIGAEIARLLLQKREVRLVGAVDNDPDKIGWDLGRVAGVGRDLGVIISDDATQVLKTQADVVIHCTSSCLPDVEKQLMECVDAGHSVISTCEELVYPFRKHPHLSNNLDSEATKRKVAILGVGINPGFLMDKLVLTLASACQRVNAVEVTRIVDAGCRRLPLQKKIGAGLSLNEFSALVASGQIKHHGLPESVAMIADSLELRVEDIRETIRPVIARTLFQTSFLEVQPGQVAGICQTACGIASGEKVIQLTLQMYVGAENSVDEIRLQGVPALHCRIPGGVHGDVQPPPWW